MEERVTLGQAAEILGLSYSTVSKECRGWKDLGIRVLQRKEGAHKQYYKSDIIALAQGKFKSRGAMA